MDIIFSFGEHFYEQTDSSVLINFLLTFLSAFLGLLSALYLSKRDERKLKKNRILYLNTLLENLIRSSTAQIEKLEEFIHRVNDRPQDHHKISWFASHDIKRYLKFDSQELFDAYIQQEKFDKQKIKSFNEINAYIDLIDQLIDQVKEISHTYTQSTFKRQLEIKSKIERVSDEIAVVAERIKIDNLEDYRDKDVYYHLNESLNTFHRLIRETASIDRFLFEFIDPLRKAIMTSNFHHHYNLDPTLLESKSAFILYNDLKVDSDQAGIEIAEIVTKLRETIDKLRKTYKTVPNN